MKVCKDCQIEKPLSEFHNNKQAKDGKQYYCKPCQLTKVSKIPNHRANVRKGSLKKRYGITPEDYDDLFRKQKGVCDICQLPEPETSKREYLCIDHDHKTGIVRGLLCHDCNIGIGKFKDDIQRLKSAIFYIEKTDLMIESKIRQMLLDNMEDN